MVHYDKHVLQARLCKQNIVTPFLCPIINNFSLHIISYFIGKLIKCKFFIWFLENVEKYPDRRQAIYTSEDQSATIGKNIIENHKIFIVASICEVKLYNKIKYLHIDAKPIIIIIFY